MPFLSETCFRTVVRVREMMLKMTPCYCSALFEGKFPSELYLVGCLTKIQQPYVVSRQGPARSSRWWDALLLGPGHPAGVLRHLIPWVGCQRMRVGWEMSQHGDGGPGKRIPLPTCWLIPRGVKNSNLSVLGKDPCALPPIIP